ncbi:MBL fold metallo-hydrolase [Algoriphagus sp. PAP.12]|uniref:MBL fold metallo-hydrolase n=1 Tax=Algoriphagus sp. PAP.12 TaxID=2996678 RepID=UPI00227B522A|nr:MBL fold metallo-hydrolase [Algoriphagus sp. PAP.12]
MSFKQFGGKITPQLLEQYEKSPNWNKGKFQNLQETTMDIGLRDYPKLIRQQLKGRAERIPKSPIPILPFQKEEFLAHSEQMKFVWYGHSVMLMRLDGKTILIDPMLGPDSSPIGPIRTSRFSEGSLDLIDDFPEIDLIVMTHDHYDHLDLSSILRLKGKVKKYIVALGVKRHLIRWGIDEKLITELDWWGNQELDGIKVTFTPSRHFSGRGLRDRAQSLWGGWVFQGQKETIWVSGDGGYGPHFKEIGDKFGGFDFGFMECGQYNELWRQIHMFPDESVQAATDAGVNLAMPIHWAGFTLAPHHWTEPVEGFIEKASELQLDYIIPQIGELQSLATPTSSEWWKKY